MLQSRASKIAKPHGAAAMGELILPAGISQEDALTVMPIPLEKYSKTEKADRKKYEPVTVLYRK